jgi:hypothetical protein
MGFEIMAADLCGEVLILCGRSSTLALWVGPGSKGEILWEEGEAGEFYAGPYFHEGVVLTVRKSPTEVSFRKLGTGRLLSRLSLPGLTTNRKHPVYAGESGEQNPGAAEALETYPAAFHRGVLAVTDGQTYHVVDVGKRELRWSRGADKLDPSVEAAYRFWLDGERLWALKPYYSVLENCVFDLKSGEMLWRRREGGKKVELKGGGAADTSKSTEGTEATGLVLSSMVYVDGKMYGIKYQMNAATVELVGVDPVSGNEVLKIEEKGYAEPEAEVLPSRSAGCVGVRVKDGENFEIWLVDVKAKKLVRKMQLTAYGRWGNYGEASGATQGPYLGIWAYERRKLAVK